VASADASSWVHATSSEATSQYVRFKKDFQKIDKVMEKVRRAEEMLCYGKEELHD
jgi:stalled ribosome rescue protein Dom34